MSKHGAKSIGVGVTLHYDGRITVSDATINAMVDEFNDRASEDGITITSIEDVARLRAAFIAALKGSAP